ncbi:MAG: agmatine deiminase family protein [bacterium]
MFSRRRFLQLSSVLPMIFSAHAVARVENNPSARAYYMPEEGHKHHCTWMAFGASQAIWGKRLLPAVQDNLATLANTIAHYEPVKLLVRERDYELAAEKCNDGVELIVHPLDDLWMRDTGTVFVQQANGRLAGVDFNFNGWGNKQGHQNDARVARFMCEQVNIPRVSTDLVMEGGSIEVDGEGTAIATESCILNNNRNPAWTKKECEAELKYLLGIEKMIWLPGVAGKDITDGHTDFYARFTQPTVVVNGLESDPSFDDYQITREHQRILEKATDAKGRRLKVVNLESPRTIRPDFENAEFAAGYIGFYVANKVVIAQNFGDVNADQRTKRILQDLFPDRRIEMLNLDAIAAGGGSAHCATQQQPFV